MFSYFIFSFIGPLFSGKNPFKDMGGAFKNLLSQFSSNNRIGFTALLLGAGAALIAYNFFTGIASFQNSMIGIASFLLGLRALVSRAGFLRSFATSLAQKFIGDRRVDLSFGNRFIAGWSTGFIAAVPMSALPMETLPYLVGAFCLMAGLVLLLSARRTGQEVAAA